MSEETKGIATNVPAGGEVHIRGTISNPPPQTPRDSVAPPPPATPPPSNSNEASK